LQCHRIKSNKIALKSEFERFYQGILRTINHIPDSDILKVKTKLLSTYNKYSSIKVPYRYRKTITNLSNNNNIVLLKQDKGRGIVIIDKEKYTEKCLSLLETQQFTKLDKDPTKTIEGKIQRAVRGIKSKLTEQEYRDLYPSGSRPGKFYGTAKIHKLKDNEGIEQLPLRPIISNINTASYRLAKYLSKLLSPLSKSQYTVSSTKDFINKLKNHELPTNRKMISFDVSALFTNVPLEYTIDIILTRIFDHNEIQTDLTRKELHDLLLLCTKHVHFSYNDTMYIQKDGVAMGSPLGPVLAGIFMVELERTLLPQLVMYMTPWWRYVDDTFAFIKEGCVNNVLQAINNFHTNINFTYELENDNKISFLDVLIHRQPDRIDTSVYRKPTNNDVFLHWDSFAPKIWKKGTLRTLILRAHTICSSTTLREKEIQHLRKVFHEINGYPWNVIKQVIEETERKLKQPPNPPQFETYTSTKLSTKFDIKDKTLKEHENNVVYKIKCPEENCYKTYIGETRRRVIERMKDHSGRDHNSQVFKHSIEKGHQTITMNDITLLAKGFKTNSSREISEAFYIKEQKPSLNIQSLSKPIKLFF